MANLYSSVTQTVGGTPLVQVHRLVPTKGASVYAKLESHNPLASVKDRIGVAMIEAAERDGKINEKTLIVEPTSGNTGIALAFVAAARGYRLLLTMPESMSLERRKVLKALGAELVLTPAAEGMKGAINKAEEIARPTRPLVHAAAVREPGQPGGPPPHDRRGDLGRHRTARWTSWSRGVGTGGTITGVAEVIKARRPSFKAIAVEPAQSPVLTQTLAGQPLKPGPAQDPGHRRGLRAEGAEPEDRRRGHRGRPGRGHRVRPPRRQGRGPVRRHLLGRGAVRRPPWWPRGPRTRARVIVAIVPSFGERYLSTALFADLVALTDLMRRSRTAGIAGRVLRGYQRNGPKHSSN